MSQARVFRDWFPSSNACSLTFKTTRVFKWTFLKVESRISSLSVTPLAFTCSLSFSSFLLLWVFRQELLSTFTERWKRIAHAEASANMDRQVWSDTHLRTVHERHARMWIDIYIERDRYEIEYLGTQRMEVSKRKYV